MGTDDQVSGYSAEPCECRNPPEHTISGHPLPGKVSHETLEARVQRYLDAMADRDQLVRDLYNHWPMNKKSIAHRLGMGRTTVYRILGANYVYDHGRERWTDPKDKVSQDTGLKVSHET